MLDWSGLDQAPQLPGLYAWYYRPLLTPVDVKRLIENLNAESDFSKRKVIVASFLEKHIFSNFKELPYRAELSGQLKPKYAGELLHQPTISSSLLERVAERPETAWDLKQLFDSDLHFLSSPIYIGMAKNLKQRLGQHSGKINDLRSAGLVAADLEEDSAFANTVVSRKMYPPQLSVCIQVYDDVDKIANLENLLNRVFFPVFGRN